MQFYFLLQINNLFLDRTSVLEILYNIFVLNYRVVLCLTLCLVFLHFHPKIAYSHYASEEKSIKHYLHVLTKDKPLFNILSLTHLIYMLSYSFSYFQKGSFNFSKNKTQLFSNFQNDRLSYL